MTDNPWMNQPDVDPYPTGAEVSEPHEVPDPMAAWRDKTPAEIVHEFAVIRGDLVTQSGRDALTRVINYLLAEAMRYAAEGAWDEGGLAQVEWLADERRASQGFAPMPPIPSNPYRKAAQQ